MDDGRGKREPAQLRAAVAVGDDRGQLAPGACGIAAVTASGDRTEKLRGIRVPTVVIHGDRDMMVHPSGGRETARAIPGAKLITIEGMGHDLPRGAWDQIVDAIVENAARADGSAERAAA